MLLNVPCHWGWELGNVVRTAPQIQIHDTWVFLEHNISCSINGPPMGPTAKHLFHVSPTSHAPPGLYKWRFATRWCKGVSRGSSTSIPTVYVLSWWEPFSSKHLWIKIKTDRRATKRETIFDNAHQQINCTRQLLHADQSYYSITLMSIAINSQFGDRRGMLNHFQHALTIAVCCFFLQQEQFCQKNSHARMIYVPATNRCPNNCNRMHDPLSNHL